MVLGSEIEARQEHSDGEEPSWRTIREVILNKINPAMKTSGEGDVPGSGINSETRQIAARRCELDNVHFHVVGKIGAEQWLMQ